MCIKSTLFFILLCSKVLAQSVSYSVTPTPFAIVQVKDNGCWATTYAMMASWRQRKMLDIGQAVKAVSPAYELLYLSDSGMSAEEKRNFIKDAILAAEAPQNFSIKGWELLLKNHGPLWVTTDEAPVNKKVMIHARLLIGIEGDGTAEKTQMTFIDPQSGTVNEKFSNFLPKFESEVRRKYRQLNGEEWPANVQLRIQVIHW